MRFANGWLIGAAVGLAVAGCRRDEQRGGAEGQQAEMEQAQRRSEKGFSKAEEAQEAARKAHRDATEAQEELGEAERKLQEKRQEAGSAQQEAEKAARQASSLAGEAGREASEAQAATNAPRPGAQVDELATLGRIGSVGPEELVVEREGEPPLRLQVEPSTAVFVDGRQSSPDALTEGRPVRASYRLVNGQPVAIRVEAVPEHGAGRQPAPQPEAPAPQPEAPAPQP